MSNVEPVADAVATPAIVPDTETSIDLDGTGSSDSDGTIASYKWELIVAPDGKTGSFSDATAATCTFTPGSFPESPDYMSHGLLVAKSGLDQQPASGLYWDQLVVEADRTDHPVAEFNNVNGRFGMQTFAKALRYARLKQHNVADATIDGYRTEVVNRLQDFNALTLDSTKHLGHSRQLTSLILAADFINLGSANASADTAFRTKITDVVNLSDGAGTDGFSTIVDGAKVRPNNIGMSCRLAVTAHHLYTGAADSVIDADVLQPLRRWLGDTGYHVGGFNWNSNQTWQLDPATGSTWVGLNPTGSRDGHAFGGIQPEDQRRGTPASYDSTDFPNTLGNAYIYQTILDAAWIALMLRRSGRTGALAWSDNAILRGFERLDYFDANFAAKGYDKISTGTGAAQIGVMANFLYGQNWTIVDPSAHFEAYEVTVGYCHMMFNGRTV